MAFKGHYIVVGSQFATNECNCCAVKKKTNKCLALIQENRFKCVKKRDFSALFLGGF
jgi:hypothetical protein